MAHRAEQTPDAVAVVFDEVSHSYGQIWERIRGFAAYLIANGVGSGDRVVLCLNNSARFFAAYYGVQSIGAVSVPIYHGSSAARIGLIAGLCGARALVTDQPCGPDVAAQTQGATHLDLASGWAHEPGSAVRAPKPRDLAMLQYTSGTTGNPKGVQLSHANLIANTRQMIAAVDFRPEDVFVSWLPVYHDLGLIMMTMCPFYLGGMLVLLPVSPRSHPWLGAIKEHGGTVTASPDFGYRFCTKFSKSSDHYDLSSLRLGVIAAEPVRERTVRRFEQKFGLENVLKPGYGLAEASVAVSVWGMDRPGIKVDGQGNVSAGRPVPGTEIRILQGDRPVESGEQGEIAIKSPSCTRGYYANPEATQSLAAPDGYVRTGDIGYLDHEGDLFIVGRAKNIIIRGGQNLSPREVEEAAEEVEGVRLAAAIGIEDRRLEGEQLHLFAEIDKRRAKGDLDVLSRQLIEAIHHMLGYRPDKVHLLKTKSIPRTFNGKLQYNQLRTDFLSGSLVDQEMILFPVRRDALQG